MQKSNGESFEVCLRAAERGDLDSQYKAGLSYEYGDNVPQDDKQAATWYLKAAQRGHPKAQFNLGWLYELGEGVSQDSMEAFKWFSAAAGQGFVDAQNRLGTIFYEGNGVKQDLAEAYFWHRLAELSVAGADAPTADKEAVMTFSHEQASHIAKKLSATQLATTNQRISEWKAKHGK